MILRKYKRRIACFEVKATATNAVLFNPGAGALALCVHTQDYPKTLQTLRPSDPDSDPQTLTQTLDSDPDPNHTLILYL